MKISNEDRTGEYIQAIHMPLTPFSFMSASHTTIQTKLDEATQDEEYIHTYFFCDTDTRSVTILFSSPTK